MGKLQTMGVAWWRQSSGRRLLTEEVRKIITCETRTANTKPWLDEFTNPISHCPTVLSPLSDPSKRQRENEGAGLHTYLRLSAAALWGAGT
jgi:hypothetical protein